MIRLIPFACTSSLSEPRLTIGAATRRWTSAGRRPMARCAASTRTTLVRRRGRGGTLSALIATPDQDRPRPLRPDRTRRLGRRSTAGQHGTISTMNRIMELPRVTRPAKKRRISPKSETVPRDTPGAEPCKDRRRDETRSKFAFSPWDKVPCRNAFASLRWGTSVHFDT